MVFSSIVFLIFFLPAFIGVYLLLPKKLKNFWILLASILFYSWGAPRFIAVILATTILDFILVKQIEKAGTPVKKKLMLVVSLIVNLSLLFYFKYANFFIDNINSIIYSINDYALLPEGYSFVTLQTLEVIMPIGISFYTFESITYVVDVYRGEHKSLDNFWDYQLYIIFFPKLIAGPIVRYSEIGDQISNRNLNYDAGVFSSGLFRFILGLSKKLIIANQMALVADKCFGLPSTELTSAFAWIGIVAYTLQIYFDFSGYSDMALGLASLMGFKLPENFNNPYTAVGITNFWRQWHMTLGTWMRNYLYIPLGGNKVGLARTYFNLWLVFLASGFWHGASWAFIAWGAYHGLFLVLERAFLLNWLNKLPKLISVVLTFFIVMIGWVYFRADTIAQANHYINCMFSFNSFKVEYFLKTSQWFYLILGLFLSFFILYPKGPQIQNYFYSERHSSAKQVISTSILGLLLLTICIGKLASSDFNPFIYFRF